jgi:predicted Zn-dependent protease
LAVLRPILADELPDLGEAARAEFSPQLERKIGERILNEIRLREPSYVDDPEISTTSIAWQSPGGSQCEPDADCQFFLIRDNTVNAFAMFGGFIGVNTGTLLTAQSESELAGVLAHEISHVTQNHLARQIAREKQSSIATMIAMAIGVPCRPFQLAGGQCGDRLGAGRVDSGAIGLQP